MGARGPARRESRGPLSLDFFPKASEQPIPRGLCHLAQGCLNTGWGQTRASQPPRGCVFCNWGSPSRRTETPSEFGHFMTTSRGSETPGWRTKSLRDRLVHPHSSVSGSQLNRSMGILPDSSNWTPSASRSARCRVPERPLKLRFPWAPTTRCQGTSLLGRRARMAQPTLLAPRGFPRSRAAWP